jgi:hypothetical protein
MEVDDENSVYGEQVTVSSDETYFSAVNYQGFPRQLTTTGFEFLGSYCRGDKNVFYSCVSALSYVSTTIFTCELCCHHIRRITTT